MGEIITLDFPWQSDGPIFLWKDIELLKFFQIYHLASGEWIPIFILPR